MVPASRGVELMKLSQPNFNPFERLSPSFPPSLVGPDVEVREPGRGSQDQTKTLF